MDASVASTTPLPEPTSPPLPTPPTPRESFQESPPVAYIPNSEKRKRASEQIGPQSPAPLRPFGYGAVKSEGLNKAKRRASSDADKTSPEVVLNVYDLNPTDAEKKIVTNFNNWSQYVGLGAFHSGVQIYGMEWSFGSSAEASSAIQPCMPRQCCPHQYHHRTSISLGRTQLSPEQVIEIITDMRLSEKYQGYSYDMLKNNCNDFSHELCLKLIGKGIPKWVNRGARALDQIIETSDKVSKHPVTKSMNQALKIAGEGVRAGASASYRAAVHSWEASRKYYAQIGQNSQWFQCIANVGLLRTCYGIDDSKGGGEERKRENTSSSGGESSLSFAVENREAKLSEMVRLSSVTDTESTVLPESNSFT